MNKPSIKLLACQVLAHYKFAAGQHILTLSSEFIAKNAKPGQFVHLQVGGNMAMRRPISIMTVDIENDTFDLLYKTIGEGTQQLAKCQIGDILSIMGPIGNGFNISRKDRPLLIGGGVGMPPIIAIAQQIKHTNYNPFVILGSEVEFPFTLQTAKNNKSYAGATSTMPQLEEWGIEARLTSKQNYEGVYNGYVSDLAKIYLDDLNAKQLAQVEVYACGPEPMLFAVAALAKKYNLPCQLSLEEYMACAVGGCAGCVVKVKNADKISMRRVCVDGPVFMADTVFYD